MEISNGILTSAALVVLILLDATGDAFRDREQQMWHHVMEILAICLWVAVWASFAFVPGWIIVYFSARIWLFDPVRNLCIGDRILYVGKNDPWGWFIRWFAQKVKQPYEHFSFMFKLIAFAFWIGWNIKILT